MSIPSVIWSISILCRMSFLFVTFFTKSFECKLYIYSVWPGKMFMAWFMQQSTPPMDIPATIMLCRVIIMDDMWCRQGRFNNIVSMSTFSRLMVGPWIQGLYGMALPNDRSIEKLEEMDISNRTGAVHHYK